MHVTEDKRKKAAYDHEKPLSVLGTFQAEVFVVGHEQNRQRCEFVVISEKGITLLGKESAEKLHVLRVGLPNDVHTCSVTEKNRKQSQIFRLVQRAREAEKQTNQIACGKGCQTSHSESKTHSVQFETKGREENRRTRSVGYH